MTNKIKLLLCSLLAICSIFSTTTAVDITSFRSSEVDCITEKLGKNLLWVNGGNYYSSNYFECLYKSIDPEDDYFKNYSKKSNTNFFENKKYIYMEGGNYSDFFWSYNPFYIVSVNSSNYKLWKDDNGLYVFSVLENEEKKSYKRVKLNVKGDTPIKVSSKRGSNIYKKGIVLDGLQLFTKDGDQMRVASIIDNSYTLDGFSFLDVNGSFRLLDTYKNKMYKYLGLSSDEKKYISKWLFYNLYNIKPEEIYDVVWNVGTDGKFYYEYGKYLNFSLENKKIGTKEDLKIIQEDLKDSLKIIDKENVEYYLGMSPEDLGISSNPDLPKNQDKGENNENNKSYEENLKEYNSCTSYWNNIKTYTTYDKECYRSLLDSAPLTGAVNHKKLLAPWNAVVNWNGEGELDIDTEDRICLQFKDRKAVYKQKRSKQWEEFLAISKENWLSPSGINVAEKCGQRPEKSGSFLDKLGSKYQDRREYIELKVACLASFGVAPEVCKKLDDPNSKNSIIAENNKGRDILSSGQNKPLLEPKEYILKAWNVVYDPFYSGYVNTTFLPAQCGSYKNDVFSIFAYLFLFSLFLYFIKFM